MISISCAFKKRIIGVETDLEALKRDLAGLESRWEVLRPQFVVVEAPVKKVKAYKAVKGDPVDELMQFHLQKNNCTLKVVRTAPGKYLFGTKNIMAKVINGKLVIRVGGGYMGADEFIQQYGPMEMAKVMEANGESVFTKSGDRGRVSMKGDGGKKIMEALREKMKSGGANDVMNEGLGVKADDDNVNNQSIKARKLESLSGLLKAN